MALVVRGIGFCSFRRVGVNWATEGLIRHMNIAVLGAGYVGLATAIGLAELGHMVEICELRDDRREALASGIVPVYEPAMQNAYGPLLVAGRVRVASTPSVPADITMVCVGTPTDESGRADLSELKRALKQDVVKGSAIVIRSTVPAGSTQVLADEAGIPRTDLFISPEFLVQGSALEQFLDPYRVVIGAFAEADLNKLALVRSAFSGLPAPVLTMSVPAAEIAKAGANAFIALKIGFAHELAVLCEEAGADVEVVLRAISLDPRIGPSLMAPSFGFGGSCLPKDLDALAHVGREHGVRLDITEAIASANSQHIQRFAERIDRAVSGVGGKTLALLGLAFKAGTDDTRHSPSLQIARWLLARGAIVHAYDPQAHVDASGALAGLETRASALDAIHGADAVIIGTEWPEFRAIDWEVAGSHVRERLVLDGRRVLDANHLRSLGYRYIGVGLPD